MNVDLAIVEIERIEEIFSLSNSHLPVADRLRAIRLFLEDEIKSEDDVLMQMESAAQDMADYIKKLEFKLNLIHRLSDPELIPIL